MPSKGIPHGIPPMAEGGFLIAVHAGAGYHSLGKEVEYKVVCAKACSQAVKILKSGGSALDAVTVAIQSLEDSPLTNAGHGSNLTLAETVECDASIMDGQSLLHGAVGALSGIQNPICLARKLVNVQKQGTLLLGRIPPSFLVGTGAAMWAKENGISVISEDKLKSESAMKTFNDHKRRLERQGVKMLCKKRKTKLHIHSNNPQKVLDLSDTNKHADDNHSEDSPVNGIQDTVGSICIDCHGNLAAGVSSGGISLKQPGRVGPAAVYGAGCWATNTSPNGRPGVAVVTSGTGEHLMRTLLAKSCAENLYREEDTHRAIEKTLTKDFLESGFLSGIAKKYGGILAVKQAADSSGDSHSNGVDLIWSHTTESMCIAYMTSKEKRAKSLISRLSEDSKAGQSLIIQGKHFVL
ncbi:hypothetical protein CHS0354_007400 [Potamilus streckersoni]|uniref:Threonine aspartase n=1 Tax=Potamilus streckersoni TaxID=2493646 RepID=A0AAE0SRM1_9BIVA|nr:hypothetical protein CHS0354_007400 [Potamilus streckersoni]